MNRDILKNIKVLYAEDEVDVREFTGKTIGSLVKEIVMVANGLEGAEAFKEQGDFDLIVTDINMPKLGGLEMCAEIKKINPEIPIVITSAHNDPDFLKKAIDVGVTAYSMKPVDLYQLIESMIKAVEPIFLRKQLEQTNEELKSLNVSLEERVNESVKKIKSILDSQDNIIVVTSTEHIDSVNKKFLEFFNIKSVDTFIKENHCLCDMFSTENDRFFSNNSFKEGDNWIEKMLSLPEIDRVVQIKAQNGNNRTFAVHIDNYEHEGGHFVITLSDITEIKEKSRLLEYQANHDTLTGLYNRQKFHDIFEKEFKRDKRYENSLSLIAFDIDHFKDFNDIYGHAIGDEVLKCIAAITTRSVREHDTVVRWGGEEFMILLPQTDLEGATSVAEKVRVDIENYNDEKLPRGVTSSFGVTILKENDDMDSFVNRADEALYEAKRTGRNKVVTKI